MSHYSISKVELKGANLDLLRRALENIAQRQGGKIVNEIRDYYGNLRSDIDIGIITPKLHRGVGIRVKEDGIELVGDFYGYRHHFENFKQELLMEYTAVAMEDALQEMGYMVQEEREGESIVLRAYEM